MHLGLSTALLLALVPSALAQDLYDTSVLRSIDLDFHDTNWWNLLGQNYASQTEILADLTMEGVTYPDVGVRIRGNTSYTALPPGAEKVSLNISMDAVHADQDLLGYNSLNLNNSFVDPTFCREVAYNNFVAQYIPNGRANHVLLTLEGQDWGVYVNVQQFNKDMLRDYFADEDGMRVKCANNPFGPGLRYVGNNPGSYSGYEIKNDGGLLDPWGALIEVCNAVTNTSLANWEQIDTVFAIDPSIWSVVLENLFTDDDSYVNKGADFVTYRDPQDGRMHLLQTDGNESWSEPDWSPTRNFNQPNKPVLSHVLAVPELRQRYMAHMRTALEEFDWAQLEPMLLAHRDQIDAAVQADPKKLYSYQYFLDNFTMTVNLGGGGPFGGSRIGLEEFVEEREALLEAHPELSAPAPEIPWVVASSDFPDLGETVFITAQVEGPIDPVATVELFYLPAPGSYERVPMLDDGLSGDGLAGDGVYGTVLPVSAGAGQVVRYYVAAVSDNSTSAMTFHPRLTELDPRELTYAFGGAGLRITEYLYSGEDGEFVELTNTSDQPLDLSGWSLDDQSAEPGVVDLSSAGIVVPGQSIVVTESDPVAFAAAWGLSGVVVVGTGGEAGLGRNDQINVFDDQGQVQDRLTYGDEDFPGSVRARDFSAQACQGILGTDDAYGWVLAEVGDDWGAMVSTGGDTGSPGAYSVVPCAILGANYCTSSPNSTGIAATIVATGSASVADNDLHFAAVGCPPGLPGIFYYGDTQLLLPFGNGTRCVGGNASRFGVGTIDGMGVLTTTLDLTTTGGSTLITGGTSWNFQGWFRDPAAGGSSFDLSDALQITFLP